MALKDILSNAKYADDIQRSFISTSGSLLVERG